MGKCLNQGAQSTFENQYGYEGKVSIKQFKKSEKQQTLKPQKTSVTNDFATAISVKVSNLQTILNSIDENFRFGLVNKVDNIVKDYCASYLKKRKLSIQTYKESLETFGLIYLEKGKSTFPFDILKGISAKLTEPMTYKGVEYRLKTKISFAQNKLSKQSLESIMEHSVLSLESMDSTDISFKRFTEDLKTKTKEDFELESQLNQSIANDKFKLFYQPQRDIVSGKIIGAEALLRWEKDGNIVYPKDFMGIAVQSGLITDIGFWQIKRVASDLPLFMEKFGHNFKLSLNFSLKQLAKSNTYLKLLQSEIYKKDLSQNLCIEITEDFMASNFAETKSFTFALKEMGLKVALDDFGTGYSSLAYLNDFHFDTIKIDYVFISKFLKSDATKAIVSYITKLAHGLNKTCVAEGVTNFEEVKALKEIECDIYQGFELPISISDFIDLSSTL